MRRNQAAAIQGTVFVAVITSQSVGHWFFFDPFVMISIQPVRAQDAEWLVSHKSCISSLLPHWRVCNCIRPIVSPKCHISSVCVWESQSVCDGRGGPFHDNERRLGGSYQLGSAFWLRAATTPSQHAFNNRRPVTSRKWDEVWADTAKSRKMWGERAAGKLMKGGGSEGVGGWWGEWERKQI